MVFAFEHPQGFGRGRIGQPRIDGRHNVGLRQDALHRLHKRFFVKVVRHKQHHNFFAGVFAFAHQQMAQYAGVFALVVVFQIFGFGPRADGLQERD